MIQVAKENADVIILEDNFSTIVNVAKWGRAVYINIQKFVQFQLTFDIVALMINFISACISGSAPLTVVQLLWVNLIMDTLGALALATKPPHEGLMNRPPVGRGVSFITRAMWRNIAGSAPLTVVQLLWANLIMDTLGALALATEPPHEGLMNRPPVGRGVSFITRAMWRNIAGQSIYQMAVLFMFNFAGKKILGFNCSDATIIVNNFIFNTFVFCQVLRNGK